jgi:hypothetical protein
MGVTPNSKEFCKYFLGGGNPVRLPRTAPEDRVVPTKHDLLCPIARYLKGTILLDKSYIRILLVCFVGTTQPAGAVRGKRTRSPTPKKWNLGSDSPILTLDLLCPIAR